MFGYYSEEPKIGNKTPILVDSYIFENYRLNFFIYQIHILKCLKFFNNLDQLTYNI